MNKTIEILPIALLLSASFSLKAETLKLDFAVDIYSHLNDQTLTNPNVSFNYSVYVELDNYSNQSGGFPNGNPFAGIFFTDSFIPETSLSQEVLSQAGLPLLNSWSSASLQREYQLSIDQTYESQFYTTVMYADIFTQDYQYHTQYERGVSTGIEMTGNQVTEFTQSNFKDYMVSLIGSSPFFFKEVLSKDQRDLATGEYVYANGWQYNYFGNATLVSVQTVPIPAATWLFGSGLMGLIGIARRKA